MNDIQDFICNILNRKRDCAVLHHVKLKRLKMKIHSTEIEKNSQIKVLELTNIISEI